MGEGLADIVAKNEAFAAWLRAQLAARGWSQRDLAATGVATSGAISGWARGAYRPLAETCLALAKVLDLPAETVLAAAARVPRTAATTEVEVVAALARLEDVLRAVAAEIAALRRQQAVSRGEGRRRR